MGTLDHPICLLRNLYAGQEATVKTGHGTTDWFQIGKGIHQGCILSPSYLTYNAEYIMRNAGLDGAQAGNKVARRNINKLWYADDITLMPESEEELSLLMKVKEGGEEVGAWCAAVLGVGKSQTRLSNWTELKKIKSVDKEVYKLSRSAFNAYKSGVLDSKILSQNILRSAKRLISLGMEFVNNHSSRSIISQTGQQWQSPDQGCLQANLLWGWQPWLLKQKLELAWAT